MPKPRHNSPKAKLRWTQELVGGGVSGSMIWCLLEELLHQVVWAKAITAKEGHVARKAKEWIEDEI